MVAAERRQPVREITIPVTGPSEEKGVPSEEPAGKSSFDQGKAEEYIDQLQRLQAEFKNYRRRIDEERKSLFSLAKSELVLKMLPVLDDFERMIHHQNGDCQINLEGVSLIFQNFKKALAEEGLEEIPALNEVFNPEVHEAVGVEETDANRDGIVVEEWQKGYRFGERMLRPSRVKVGKAAERSEGA